MVYEPGLKRRLAGIGYGDLTATRFALPNNTVKQTVPIPDYATHVRIVNVSTSGLNFRWDGVDATTLIGILMRTNTTEVFSIPSNAVDMRFCTVSTDANAFVALHFYSLFRVRNV